MMAAPETDATPFMDEMHELARETLGVLRQPLEEGERHGQPRIAEHDVSSRVHPGGGDESVPVRISIGSAACV